ncbi:hypothetical protein VTL71DRAFT_15507 [Oculimacula yallundae]|uniref:RAI1-like domain-containing protein n=1 Tax=Oculimacula yallundae TaxID=86028 RepID=A0ABR4CJ47_9HELO
MASSDTILSARLGNLSLQQNPNSNSTAAESVPARRTRRRQGPTVSERMLWGVSNLISTIYVGPPEDEDRTSAGVTIKNLKSVASYNWKDVEHPTIYVPGLPPKFTPPTLPTQLQKDNLTRSAPRSPAAPVDPLFQAILHEHPDYDMSSIEVVTTRNSLRDLLDFASNRSGKWRLDIDMIHGTMFINQWEEFRLMLINGRQNSGYGHAFEDCLVTKEQHLEDSLHHERIVRYELGGLEFMVRFEADAYIAGEDDETSHDLRATVADSTAPVPTPPVLRPPYKLVHAISRGRAINSDQIIELKSCGTNAFSIQKTMPQLWFSQTKHLCVGYHKDGLLTKDLEMRDMTEELSKWEENNQESLKNMIRIIKEIKDIARTARKVTVICSAINRVKCLSVYRRNGRAMTIRPEVKTRCWKN